MALLDDTRPIRPTIIPPDMVEGDEDNSPGCFVWGVVLFFSLLLALGIVGMAGFAGWGEGLRIGQGNATATRNADITTQCDRLPQDLANGSVGLAQARLDSLVTLTPSVPCVATYAPTATALFLQSMATATLPPTPTETASPTPTVTQESTPAESVTVATPTASTSGGFDLSALLAEAQQSLVEGKNRQAIDTLDAISAVDPQFQKGIVDQLTYQALTTEARRLFRTGTNLAEAILLTTRAEQYGDVGDLSYERYIAEIYLQALIYQDTNFPRAIQQFSVIVYTQGLPNYLNASSLLNGQYVKYGDALALGGDYCNAQRQYESALGLFTNNDVSIKLADVTQKCQQGGIFATPDPNQPTPEGGAGGGSGDVAPIGVRP